MSFKIKPIISYNPNARVLSHVVTHIIINSLMIKCFVLIFLNSNSVSRISL